MSNEQKLKNNGKQRYLIVGSCNYEGLMILPAYKATEYYYPGDPMVWLLYPDGSRTLAQDLQSILEHQSRGGEFAIKEADWHRAAEPYSRDQGQYDIYQVKNDGEYHGIRFAGYSELREAGRTPDLNQYDHVYRGRLARGEFLDDLYQKFNLFHPDDYKGRSMSVSDIVAIDRNKILKLYYVDTVGFVDITDIMQGRDKLHSFEQSRETPALKKPGMER